MLLWNTSLRELKMEVELHTTAEVKELLSNMEIIKRFPMICYEKDESRLEGKTASEIMDEAKTMEYTGEWMRKAKRKRPATYT